MVASVAGEVDLVAVEEGEEARLAVAALVVDAVVASQEVVAVEHRGVVVASVVGEAGVATKLISMPACLFPATFSRIESSSQHTISHSCRLPSWVILATVIIRVARRTALACVASARAHGTGS